jgi:hypothetical protein
VTTHDRENVRRTSAKHSRRSTRSLLQWTGCHRPGKLQLSDQFVVLFRWNDTISSTKWSRRKEGSRLYRRVIVLKRNHDFNSSPKTAGKYPKIYPATSQFYTVLTGFSSPVVGNLTTSTSFSSSQFDHQNHSSRKVDALESAMMGIVSPIEYS